MTAKARKPQPVEVPADARWVGIGDAAQLTGASLSVIRKWADAGSIPTRQGTGPRGQRTEVPLELLQERAAQLPGARPAALHAAGGTPGSEVVPAALYAALVDRVADAERARGRLEEVEADRDRLRHLHMEAVREVESLRVQLDSSKGGPTVSARRGLFGRR